MAPGRRSRLPIEAACSDQLAALGIISETPENQGDAADTFQQQTPGLQAAEVRASTVFTGNNLWMGL